jgi:hypothetical protein
MYLNAKELYNSKLCGSLYYTFLTTIKIERFRKYQKSTISLKMTLLTYLWGYEILNLIILFP